MIVVGLGESVGGRELGMVWCIVVGLERGDWRE